MIALLTLGVMGATASVGLAYFTSSGSGTNQGLVGSSSPWTVSVNAPSGGPLYPGSGSEVLTYTVTNASSGNQELAAITPVVATATDSSGDVTHNGTAVSGCLQSWFNVTNTQTPSLPQDLAGGATSTQGSVTVTMNDSPNSQDSCEGKAPDITITAS